MIIFETFQYTMALSEIQDWVFWICSGVVPFHILLTRSNLTIELLTLFDKIWKQWIFKQLYDIRHFKNKSCKANFLFSVMYTKSKLWSMLLTLKFPQDYWKQSSFNRVIYWKIRNSNDISHLKYVYKYECYWLSST